VLSDTELQGLDARAVATLLVRATPGHFLDAITVPAYEKPQDFALFSHDYYSDSLIQAILH
jgi:hypothetical protein